MNKMSRPITPPAFFAGMNQKHIDVLQRFATYAQFGCGEVIFREGSPANSFHLIDEGTVSLEADMNGEGLVQIAVLKEGDPLGWSWLFPPHMWHFHARALKRTTATFFDAKILRELCEQDHDLGYELTKRVSQVMLGRLQSTREELLKLYRERQQEID
ncbi:MAG: cyclic nucleotide-binding domain-containing protein [Burkholderiales bacterium]